MSKRTDRIASDVEIEEMIKDAPPEVLNYQPSRFIPQHLALKMGRRSAEQWLNDRDAERAEHTNNDAAIFGRILGM